MRFLFFILDFNSLELPIYAYREYMSADIANIYLLTCQKILPASPADTAMHYSKYYLLAIQLTVADCCSKLFARSLIIFSIMPFILSIQTQSDTDFSVADMPNQSPNLWYSSHTEDGGGRYAEGRAGGES